MLSTYRPRLSRIRIIKLEDPWEQLVWTIRAIMWDYPWPRFDEEWWDRFEDLYLRKHILLGWTFLRPFFESRGYILYESSTAPGKDGYQTWPPSFAHSGLRAAPGENPYARRVLGAVPGFYPCSPRVWAARDTMGRDVIIKAVSDTFEPTNELKVLQFLSSPEKRADPRNHTINVIEFITFDSCVFAVMPRWDRAFQVEFFTVAELMEVTKMCLETFDFMHENRVIHFDFLEQNIGMNIVINRDSEHIRGLRAPGEVRYALYDFGAAQQFPADTSLDTVKWERPMNFRLHHMAKPTGPYNPFKADMGALGGTLQLRVRHIENIIPALGPFFDKMTAADEEARLSAREALSSFMEIYKSLTPYQLQQDVRTLLYRRGVAERKPKRPTWTYADIEQQQ